MLGFRIGDFSYITDANHISDETIAKLKGTKVLVLNALQKDKHVSHFTLAEALVMAGAHGAEKTYFTHYEPQIGLHKDVEAELPGTIALAYDGLAVAVARTTTTIVCCPQPDAAPAPAGIYARQLLQPVPRRTRYEGQRQPAIVFYQSHPRPGVAVPEFSQQLSPCAKNSVDLFNGLLESREGRVRCLTTSAV